MDYSAENAALWLPIIQFGIIALTIIVANILRRKIAFIRDSLIPTAVLGGFMLLIVRLSGLIPFDLAFMEMLTYHAIAVGFIALSLRIPERSQSDKGNLVGIKSGAIIVSSYMIQGVTGLVISIGLAHTVMPGFFEAAGVLLPMGYGQGPGQANNIGSTYEALGFTGGHSFALAIAAAGYICACTVGVVYINWLVRKGKIAARNHSEFTESVAVETFQNENEVPISESVDRFSVQAALVVVVYLVTFLATWGITSALSAYAPGVANMVNTLLWGFNFIIGSALAILCRVILKNLKKLNWMSRQYQNNYLLSRISGLAFDFMIVAGIASIEPAKIKGLWIPFILMAVAGAIVTFLHLRSVCKRVYGEYYYEGLVSMYGMMTGTISSGILLLREIDPQLETPAANNLVIGSSFAILLAIPLLIGVGMAPQSTLMAIITLCCAAAYYVVLRFVINIRTKKQSEKAEVNE